jgi:hypothetical protein
MRVRRCLKLFLPLLLLLTALAASAGAAAPAFAGLGTGNVTDKFGNPLGGIVVEALDMDTSAQLATATTAAEDGSFAYEILPVAQGMYKVRLSDPRGIFATSYLYDQTTFASADLIGYS